MIKMKSDRDFNVLYSRVSFTKWQQFGGKWLVFLFGFLIVFSYLELLSSGDDFHRETDVQFEEFALWRTYFYQNFKRQHYKCSTMDKVQFARKISGEALEMKRFKKGPRSICKCSEKIRGAPLSRNYEFLESNCGPEATAAGENQNVISFSLYRKDRKGGKKEVYFEERYFKGILSNLRAIKTHFPGWLTRIYTNLTFEGEICELVCSDASMFFCDIQDIEGASEMHPMTWRFLPLGDSTVTKFASRDLDSLPTARERAAVGEWEKSGFPFHGMRDHPWHGTYILGGMWGADNMKLCYQNAMAILIHIMTIEWMVGTEVKLNDQQILTETIYKLHRSGVLTHDSYLCKAYKDSIPFPTKRPNDYDYIGRPVTLDNDTIVFTPLPTKCPLECRPSFGLDWEYC